MTIRGRLSLVLLAAGCASSYEPLPSSAPSVLLNAELPDFRRKTLQDVSFESRAWRGQVVVVKFFARFCAPCQETLPQAEALHREHPDIAFLGIAEDRHLREVEEQIQEFGLTFPIVHDADSVLAGRFRVTEMPATFVADSQGRIVWVGGPDQPHDDLRRVLERLSRR